MTDVQAVRWEALEQALTARTGAYDEVGVMNLVTIAHQVLSTDDPLFRAVTTFATAVDWQRHDPERLQAAGAELVGALDRLMVPVPPDLDRVDIHG